MTIHNAIAAGLAGNALSKKITGTDEVCASRTAVATGTGAVLGGIAAGTVVVGAAVVGVASAPVTIPLAVGGAVVGFVSSLFD